MTLTEYLNTTGTTRAQLSERAGLSRRTVTHLAAGEARPSAAAAQAIERATGGAVTAADWPPGRNGRTALRAAP